MRQVMRAIVKRARSYNTLRLIISVRHNFIKKSSDLRLQSHFVHGLISLYSASKNKGPRVFEFLTFQALKTRGT